MRLAGGAGAAALLAACGGGKPASTPAAPATTAASTASGSAPASNGAIVIANSGAKLPTEGVKFNWVDSGDAKALFFKPYFAAYSQAHPNIAITYDPLPFDKITTLLPIGFQNNNAPDVFQLPGQISLGQAIQNGWARPIDDLIPDFDTWKAAFPPGSFLTGLNVFEGKTYGPPLTNPGGDTSLCYYYPPSDWKSGQPRSSIDRSARP